MSQTIPSQEKPPEVPQAEAHAEKPKTATPESHVKTTRRVDGELKVHSEGLHMDMVVEPVSAETLFGGAKTTMKEASDKVNADAVGALQHDDIDRSKEVVQNELKIQKGQGEKLFSLSHAMSEVGDIFAVKPGGFDQAKSGNIVDFGSKEIYAIDKNKADHMIDLLRHPPGSLGEGSGSFDVNEKSPLDRNKNGFEMMYTYENGRGEKIKEKIVFLYVQTENVEAPAAEQKAPTVDKKPEDIGTKKTEPKQEQSASEVENPAEEIAQVEDMLAQKRAEREKLQQEKAATQNSQIDESPDQAYVPPVGDEDKDGTTNTNVAKLGRKAVNAKESKRKTAAVEDKENVAAAA